MTDARIRLATLAVGVVLLVLFKTCYESSIATNYDYYGFGISTLPNLFLALFYLAALLPLLWLPTALTQPSAATSWLLYLFVIAPVCLLAPDLTQTVNEAVKVATIFLGSHGLFEFIRRRPVRPIRRHPQAANVIRFGLPVFMLIMTAVVLYVEGFNIDLSYANIYDRRVVARDLLPGRTLVDYGVAVFSSAGIPLCLTLGYTRQRLHLVLLGLAGIVVMFALTGEKTTIFIPILIVGVLYLALRARKHFGLVLLGMTCGLVGAAILQVMYLDSEFIAEVFVRRKFAIPALLSVKYWDYFTNNDYLLFKNTLVGSLFFGPEIQSIQGSFLIGEQYFQSATNNAGANIWATGFSHLGYAGMALSSVLGAYLIRIFDSLTEGQDIVEVTVACALIGSNWSEAGLHTSLLTHGVVALLTAIYFLPHSLVRRPVGAPTWRSSISSGRHMVIGARASLVRPRTDIT